ncbi:MAG TPA: acyl carrier protein [Jatrophihabitans sp.]|nr:acyl carrier protein [Jatrophihabitans sp.]
MSDRLVELPDLRRILLEGAGAVQGVDLDGEILDSSFEDLGYDSIAIMETAARISREYGVSIDDEALLDARTPRLLLDLVNTNQAAA